MCSPSQRAFVSTASVQDYVFDELMKKAGGMFHDNLVICTHDIVITEEGDEYGKTLPSIVTMLNDANLVRAGKSDYSLNVAKNVEDGR